jgi:hypothetical protein
MMGTYHDKSSAAERLVSATELRKVTSKASTYTWAQIKWQGTEEEGKATYIIGLHLPEHDWVSK